MGNSLPSCQSPSESPSKTADDCMNLEMAYPPPEDPIYTAAGARLKAQNGGKVPAGMAFANREEAVRALLPPDVLALHES